LPKRTTGAGPGHGCPGLHTGANHRVGIVSGNSLGLDLTSGATLGQRGQLGQSALGQTAERSYVNVATGNLVVQDVDDFLASNGLDVTALRTYNSQGLMDDDNADNWSNGFYRKQLQFTGAAGSTGTVTRTGQDGSQAIYTYDDNGRLIHQMVRNNEGGLKYDLFYTKEDNTANYDGAGNMLGYILNNQEAGTQYKYTNTSEKREGNVQTSVAGTPPGFPKSKVQRLNSSRNSRVHWLPAAGSRFPVVESSTSRRS